ncbi:MAG: translation elongation factor Ts [Chloroflexi bacterium]|nr:translation elongation factor Ts [Chloroflexota bacterium]
MTVSATAVKELRELTGAGMLDCKQALEKAKGDLEKAKEILREKGLALAAKKAERETAEGVVHAYVHPGDRLGALVELDCETDFVARTEEFRQLAQDIAMQVAAMNPRYISESDVPDGTEGNPAEVCLLRQPFIKDESRTIDDLIKEAIGKIGENIRVRRFARFELGRYKEEASPP